MNQSLKLLFLFLFTGTSLLAQKGRIELGFEGGPNISPFLESGPYNYSFNSAHSSLKPGLASSAGLSFQWNSNRHFSFRTGLNFQQNNYSFTTGYGDAGTGISGSGKGSHHFDYLILPALARFTYGEKAHFFFNVGLYAGLVTRQTETIEGMMHYPYAGETTTPYSYTSNSIPDYSPIDFGAIGGIGVGIPIKKHWELSLEMRDNFGLLNVQKSTYYGSQRSLRTNTLSLLLGVSYKLSFREANK